MSSEIGDSSSMFKSAASKPAAVSAKRTVAVDDGSRGWGRGPVPVDERKFKYDVMRARGMPAVPFAVSKVDRMDADEAGDMLHRIHVIFGIETEDETRIDAFTNALFLQHTLNGGSILQPGRGVIRVEGVEFDIQIINKLLGPDARRFYRAYADEIAEANDRLIHTHDPMDPVSSEMFGQLMQVAHERNLQKYPKFSHDSSDACIHMTIEERNAVRVSKRLVLLRTVNRADAVESYGDALHDRQAAST